MSLPAFTDSPTRFIQPPNQGYTLGQKVDATPEGRAWLEGEKEGWKFIDTASASYVELYTLLISGVMPRPIGFISSQSPTGDQNLAPFSWFNSVCHWPPVVSVTPINVAGKQKDTTANIRATRQFTANLISEPFVQQANATSIEAPSSISEWTISGLTQAPSTYVKPPRVKESAFSLECELLDVIDMKDPKTGETSANLILGYVKGIHVRKDILDEKGNVDVTKAKPISRLGDITYGRTSEVYRIARPVYAEVKDQIDALEKKAAEMK